VTNESFICSVLVRKGNITAIIRYKHAYHDIYTGKSDDIVIALYIERRDMFLNQ
jgi:hypothetical protein